MQKIEKFYYCKHCGNLVLFVEDAGVPLACCVTKMEHLVPNSTDAAGEKHVPVVTIEGNTLKANVGEVTHTMADDHFIQWIYVQTERGGEIKRLTPNDSPEALFTFGEDKPVAVF